MQSFEFYFLLSGIAAVVVFIAGSSGIVGRQAPDWLPKRS
jgi:hypothetical protein